MTEVEKGKYSVRLPMIEVGHFEAKCFFVPREDENPVWVPGTNVEINVAPAGTVCGNIIYNAFIRQFGPNKSGRFFSEDRNGTIRALDEAGYAVIPSGGA